MRARVCVRVLQRALGFLPPSGGKPCCHLRSPPGPGTHATAASSSRKAVRVPLELARFGSAGQHAQHRRGRARETPRRALRHELQCFNLCFLQAHALRGSSLGHGPWLDRPSRAQSIIAGPVGRADLHGAPTNSSAWRPSFPGLQGSCAKLIHSWLVRCRPSFAVPAGNVVQLRWHIASLGMEVARCAPLGP